MLSGKKNVQRRQQPGCEPAVFSCCVQYFCGKTLSVAPRSKSRQKPCFSCSGCTPDHSHSWIFRDESCTDCLDRPTQLLLVCCSKWTQCQRLLHLMWKAHDPGADWVGSHDHYFIAVCSLQYECSSIGFAESEETWSRHVGGVHYDSKLTEYSIMLWSFVSVWNPFWLISPVVIHRDTVSSGSDGLHSLFHVTFFTTGRTDSQQLTNPTSFSHTGSGPHVSAGLISISVVIHSGTGSGNRAESCRVIKGLSLASLNSLPPCWRGAYTELMGFGEMGTEGNETKQEKNILCTSGVCINVRSFCH